ncbi:thermonuclease family protein [Sinorhizobium garamanticum]|uniref:Thermonuclease family protein n=1 Tax=Sinorhizobium garamanticum TaxID=680247 RepID=A0ABY8DA56_9HYPH|nr:thermonuclease family protein [Sinorhizobium garamanticum]WEX87766.1 thermonuclease family protein [Sinorhizobium garamanticum]
MGYVEITGHVDIFQYWPHGASDVDTLKFIPDLTTATYFSDGVTLKVGTFFERGGTFQPDDNKPGDERFRSILRRSGGASFSVRLQGIDAPETHYSPNYREGMFDGDYGKWIAKHVARQMSYRQPYGKLSTDFFANSIRSKLGVGPFDRDSPEVLVPAKLKIFADSINGAADVYGRVVGYVTLSQNGQDVVLNDVALQEGFAFCSFYGSMTVAEMQRLTELYASHGTSGARRSQLRSNLSSHLRDFEPGLCTSRSMRDTDQDDNGSNSIRGTDSFRSKCFDPKLYRRCVDWVGRREALGEPTTLLDYMRGNDEEVVMLADFTAANGDWSLARKLSMGSLIGPDGTFRYKPGEVVFEARPVTIVDDQKRPLPASFLTPYP